VEPSKKNAAEMKSVEAAKGSVIQENNSTVVPPEK